MGLKQDQYHNWGRNTDVNKSIPEYICEGRKRWFTLSCTLLPKAPHASAWNKNISKDKLEKHHASP